MAARAQFTNGRTRTWIVGVAAAVGLTLVGGGIASAQGPGRAYEMISPVEKNLGDVQRVPPASDDGDTVPFAMSATADDVSGIQNLGWTVARRTDSGWIRTDAGARMPRPVDNKVETALAMQFSSDFSKYILRSFTPFDPFDQDAELYDLYRAEVGTGNTTWLSHGGTGVDTFSTGTSVEHIWASPDLNHEVFTALRLSILGVGTSITSRAVFERIGDTIRVASVLPNASTPAPTAWKPGTTSDRSGIGGTGANVDTAVAHGGSHPVSDDGRRIFVRIGSNTTNSPLYIREDGVRTIPVSQSEATADAGTARPGIFIAANAEGTIAYFASSAALTDDPAPTGGIYRFSRLDAEGQRLKLVAPGGPSAVSSTLLSDDASRLYFVSTAALDGAAVPGDNNLYVVEGDASPRFIAALGSGGKVARVTRDGRFAVLVSTAALDGANNNGHQAIYRYDAVDDAIACVSCRRDGSASEGDASLDTPPLGTASEGLSKPRNIADDGRVYFTTKDSLTERDKAAGADVYEYADAATSLITSGTSESDSFIVDNSDDGSSVFVITRAALLSQDKDNGVADLYVARVGGGFPEPPPDPTPCLGDACQGPPTPAPSLLSPGSNVIAPSQNAAPAPRPERQGSPVIARSVDIGSLTARQRRSLARTGKTRVPVTITGAGTITVKAVGRVGKKRRTVGRGKRVVKGTAETTAHVALRLTRTARRELRRKGKLRITVEVRVSGLKKVERSSMTLRRA